MTNLNRTKDVLTEVLYGITMTDALRDGICVSCRENYRSNCYSIEGIREWGISGLCEKCFDEIFNSCEND